MRICKEYVKYFLLLLILGSFECGCNDHFVMARGCQFVTNRQAIRINHCRVSQVPNINENRLAPCGISKMLIIITKESQGFQSDE